jgi:hypothetical protein
MAKNTKNKFTEKDAIIHRFENILEELESVQKSMESVLSENSKDEPYYYEKITGAYSAYTSILKTKLNFAKIQLQNYK